MADRYAQLAPIYAEAGLNRDSESLRERLFGKIQSEGWLGRRILELGCGIGETSVWFASHGFRVTAVDESPAMLAQGQQRAQQLGMTVSWQEADFRQLDLGMDFDLIVAFDTLNELQSIRDLETVFAMANRALTEEKMLIFDLHTIQGLATRWSNADRVLVDNPDRFTLAVRSQFNYDTSMNTRDYLVFLREAGRWVRGVETHVVRGYALQAVGALLQRCGFRVQAVLDADLHHFDPAEDQAGRAVFIAIKDRAI